MKIFKARLKWAFISLIAFCLALAGMALDGLALFLEPVRTFSERYWTAMLKVHPVVPIAGGAMLMLGNDFDLIEGVPPVDLQDGNNDGDYVNVKNFSRIGVLFVSGLGTATQDPTLTIQQATNNSGGSVAALNFTTIFRKQAATNLTGTGVWTRTTQTASNTYTNGTSAEEVLMWYVEFDEKELDIANGMDHIRATVADVSGNAQPGYIMYIGKPKYPSAPESVISPL